jgi:hypothetical protein
MPPSKSKFKTRTWVCACARSFKSRRAFDQHLDAKMCVEVPLPEVAPIGSSFEQGEWVPFVDGQKRLGYFECIECGHHWMSGNSFLDSWQACKGCELDAFPMWRWRNFSRRAPKPKEMSHHDASRCQRCIDGTPCVPP